MSGWIDECLLFEYSPNNDVFGHSKEKEKSLTRCPYHMSLYIAGSELEKWSWMHRKQRYLLGRNPDSRGSMRGYNLTYPQSLKKKSPQKLWWPWVVSRGDLTSASVVPHWTWDEVIKEKAKQRLKENAGKESKKEARTELRKPFNLQRPKHPYSSEKISPLILLPWLFAREHEQAYFTFP